MIRNRALVALSAFALAGCAGGSHETESKTAQQDIAVSAVAPGATPFGVSSLSALPAAAASAPPSGSASPLLARTPTPSGSAAPASPAAAPGSSAPVSASAGTPAPRILSVHTTPAVVHDGDTLLWNVRTTPDVVDVVAHVAVYAFRLQKQGSGQYVLTFTIPHGVPGFFHGNYTLDLVARSVSGVEATTKVPVSFQ